ncbi:MAG: hypothetical protein WCF24_05020 [Acidimicrobiales bacterium]
MSHWPIAEDGKPPNPRELIGDMFHKMLEDSGYRGIDGVLREFQTGAAP